MAKQGIKFEIKDVANLILSLSELNYCTDETKDGDDIVFLIMNYNNSLNGATCCGNRLKIKIFKNKVEIFYFPTLNIVIPIKGETEYQELISLYLDFKEKVNNYLIECVKSLISKTIDNYKNAWMAFEDFQAQQRMADILHQFHPGNLINDIVPERRVRREVRENPVAGPDVNIVDFEADNVIPNNV